MSDSQICFRANEVGTAWDWQLKKLERVAVSPGFFRSLKSGSAAVLFNAPLTEIGVRSPWFYFSGGLILQVSGESYRLSFGRPANSSSEGELETVSAMRLVGKKWLDALTSE